MTLSYIIDNWTAKCGPDWLDDTTSPYCYQVHREFKQWSEARQDCKANGGDLVSILSANEQRFVSGKDKIS